MAKTKESSKPQAKTPEKNSDTSIRIIFHGSCPKLTPRGKGALEYEIGINDNTDESYLRIAGNASSGAFSTKWIAIYEIHALLENPKEDSFKAIILRELYANKSSNNHGFLAAILKAEKVLDFLPDQTSALCLKSWGSLNTKIDSLKKKDISLPDNIAVAAKKRAEKKAQLLKERQNKKDNKE